VQVLLACGCLTPAVRYSSASGNIKPKKNRTVPANYDYRTHYQVPPQRLQKIAESYLGVPYRYGGDSRRGMDCSGYVTRVYRELNRARLPRTSRQLYKLGTRVTRANARAGDLVFFRSGMFNRVNHVGVYIRDGKFIHASSSRGVIYSSLDSQWYKAHFAGIRRLF
jgi:cell wall-associated NlpC family hydrolase